MSPLCKIKPSLNRPEWMTSQEADTPTSQPAGQPRPAGSRTPTRPPWESSEEILCLCRCCWRTLFRRRPAFATALSDRVGAESSGGRLWEGARGWGRMEGGEGGAGGSECNTVCVGHPVVCRRCVKTDCLCWGGVAALGIRGNLYFCNKVITNTLPQGA